MGKSSNNLFSNKINNQQRQAKRGPGKHNVRVARKKDKLELSPKEPTLVIKTTYTLESQEPYFFRFLKDRRHVLK